MIFRGWPHAQGSKVTRKGTQGNAHIDGKFAARGRKVTCTGEEGEIRSREHSQQVRAGRSACLEMGSSLPGESWEELCHQKPGESLKAVHLVRDWRAKLATEWESLLLAESEVLVGRPTRAQAGRPIRALGDRSAMGARRHRGARDLPVPGDQGASPRGDFAAQAVSPLLGVGSHPAATGTAEQRGWGHCQAVGRPRLGGSLGEARAAGEVGTGGLVDPKVES